MKKQFILFLISLACQVSLLAQADLHERLQRLVESEMLQTSEIGIAVYDLTAQAPVFEYQSEKLFRPASVLKLITVITALDKLGPDYPFTTRIYATGIPTDGVLQGNLYVVGDMDAEFAEAEMDTLVGQIAASGIRRIEGKILGDVSMKDSLYWGAGWSWDDTPYYFQPYLSPLMYHKGVVEVVASPAAAGEPARIEVRPSSGFYSVKNRTLSKKPSAGKFDVTRNWLDNGNEILVSGNVDRLRKDRVNLYPSEDFFLHALQECLARQGIAADGYATGTCPTDSATLLASCTHTLQQLMVPALKRSDNLNAEAVFYHLAVADGRRHVSAHDAVAEVERYIKLLGFNPDAYRIADGSGVSPYNYISPRLLLAFLQYAYSHDAIYKELEPALPLSGVDGTLRNRMKSGKAYKQIRAKTGSLTGVSSLAGYATSASGHRLAFVIMNQNILKASVAKDFQNKVCEALCK